MKIILNIKLLLLTAIVTVAIAACNAKTLSTKSDQSPSFHESAAPTDCRTIEHEAGETEVCGHLQRIVALGPYVLEPLLALDVQPIGYADHVAFQQREFTEPRKQIPYLGDLLKEPLANVGLARSPSIEDIVQVQPDLILGTEFNASEYEILSEIAPTLLIKSPSYSQERSKQGLKIVAQAVDRTEKAEQLLAKTVQQVEEAQETFASLATTYPQVALIFSSNLQNIQIVTNTDNLCSSLIERLGFQLTIPPGVDSDNSSATAPISLETLPQLNNADLVILLGYDFSTSEELNNAERFKDYQLSNIKQAWQKNEIAQSLDASKARRVYFIPAYLCMGLPGPIGTELYLEELKEQLLAPN